MSELIVYKASAGSGKTHTLVREYLDLLVEYPGNYRNILAVTFTNKASEEMKNRILDELNKMVTGFHSGFFNYLGHKYRRSVKEMISRADKTLILLLHDFSHFYINTIDSFFQQVIRSFTREIGLPAGYNIEMDNDRILNEAVDRLLYNIESDESLMKWLVEFVESKIIEGGSWHLKEDILLLGPELFKETFQESERQLYTILKDKSRLEDYLGKLFSVRNHFETEYQKLGKKAIEIIESNGLSVDDFKGKSHGIAGFFLNLSVKEIKGPTPTIRKHLNNSSEWIAKSSEKSELIINLVNIELNPLLFQTISFFDDHYSRYKTAIVISNFLYTLGILTDLSQRIYEITDEKNIFLLSDSARFLHEIISDNEAPFIYEKIGNYFSYYMIDEFQDTSGMQWSNFKLLIENSLALDHKNLVVGDVKQSIYRWRNSNWEILSDKIEQDFPNQGIIKRTLLENWRGGTNLVQFNNFFFQSVRDMLCEKFDHEEEEYLTHIRRDNRFSERIRKAYSDIRQDQPSGIEGRQGYVKISFLKEQGSDSWMDMADKEVVKIIESLQDKGYSPGDIAILVRKKNEGKRLTEALLKYKRTIGERTGYSYDVISNESLLIGKSPVIRFVISVLRYINNPEDQINKAQVVSEYKKYIQDINGLEWHSLFSAVESSGQQAFEELLPQAFIQKLGLMKHLPLNELIERIIQLFTLQKQNNAIPFLQSFQDTVLEFTRTEAADINSFLTWWDDRGRTKALYLSEEQDAIRIMTIHKAKGLEFKAVIIPYCNWSLDHDRVQPIIWCKPEGSPFNQLERVPVRYSAGLLQTVFREQYLEEKFRIYVDNLNLLYVAFTRARDSLFVIAPFRGKNAGKYSKVSDLLWHVLVELRTTNDLSGTWNDEFDTWEAGELERIRQDITERKVTALKMNHYPSSLFRDKLRLNIRGIHYFDPEIEMKINYGKLLHEVYEHIVHYNDIETAVNKIFMEGKITKKEKGNIIREIRAAIDSDQVRHWFDGSWQVRNEQDIITGTGEAKRPDRIMIRRDRINVVDYKFGEAKQEKHAAQVRNYVSLLKQMGYDQVEGFIWYVKEGEIINVINS